MHHGLILILLVAVAMVVATAAPTRAATVYVVDRGHPDADDDNAGSADAPLATISAGVDRLEPGDTLRIAGGVYRESVDVDVSGTADRPVTIEAVDGEHVVISGAELVTGWQRVDADQPNARPIFKVTGFEHWRGLEASTIESGSRGRAPQLIVNGSMLHHVAQPADMHPGTFAYVPEDEAIHLWLHPPRQVSEHAQLEDAPWWEAPVDLTSDDPNDHQVEASLRDALLTVAGQANVVVRGLHLRHNVAGAQQAALEIRDSAHVTVEHCLVEFANGRGMTTGGRHLVIRHNVMRYNGALGGGGSMYQSLWENNLVLGNTTRGHGHGWEAGGVKFVRTVGSTVRACHFIENDGPGLWFDWDNTGNIVEGNFAAYNHGSGIMSEFNPAYSSDELDAEPRIEARTLENHGLEEGYPAEPNVIRNNVAVGNRWDGTWGSGILLQMASDHIVANNTVVGNEQYGIFVRYHPYGRQGHRCVNNHIFNNVMVDNGGSQIHITPDPKSDPGYVEGNVSDHNLFWDSNAWGGRNASTFAKSYGFNREAFGRWGKTQSTGAYSMEEWSKIRGFDVHSMQWEPKFVSALTHDYRLRPGSRAIGAGKASEHVQRDYRGRTRPDDRPPSLGALEYFPDEPATPAPILPPGQ